MGGIERGEARVRGREEWDGVGGVRGGGGGWGRERREGGEREGRGEGGGGGMQVPDWSKAMASRRSENTTYPPAQRARCSG